VRCGYNNICEIRRSVERVVGLRKDSKTDIVQYDDDDDIVLPRSCRSHTTLPSCTGRYVCTYKTTTGSSKIINVISGFSIQQQRFYTILFCRQSMFRGYSDMQLSIIYTCNNSLRPHDVVLYYLVRITSLLLRAHIYKKGCGHTKKYQE